jgi:biopolymer transport protein ExbD
MEGAALLMSAVPKGGPDYEHRMRLARRPAAALTMNMTPMIDVTFLLLIFFMTVNQVSVVNKEQLELPQQRGSQDQSEATLTINVDEVGALFITGEQRTLPEVISLVSDDLQAHGGDPTRINVVVRADRRGTCRGVNQIVSALDKLRIHKVNIAVEASAP